MQQEDNIFTDSISISHFGQVEVSETTNDDSRGDHDSACAVPWHQT